MKTVDALTIRNRFGEVLKELEESQEPVLISKGKKVRAVLVPIEEFERRFLDKQIEDKQREFLERVYATARPRTGAVDSTQLLRALREGS